MKRKTFVSLSLLSAASLGLHSFTRVIDLTDLVIKEPLFLSRLCDTQTILELGMTYRELFPSESDRELLIDRIIKQNSYYLISITSNKALIRSILEKEIVQDFKQGRWIELKGWVLSLTESRQCALYSLLQSPTIT